MDGPVDGEVNYDYMFKHERSFAYYGGDLPLDPPNGHNYATAGQWIIWRYPVDYVRTDYLEYPDLPEDAPSPLFRGPDEPLEPGEVFEEEEYWADGLWDRLWDEANGRTWLIWYAGDNHSFMRSRATFNKRQYKCPNRTRAPRRHSQNKSRRYHQIKQPGGSSCNQR